MAEEKQQGWRKYFKVSNAGKLLKNASAKSSNKISPIAAATSTSLS